MKMKIKLFTLMNSGQDCIEQTGYSAISEDPNTHSVRPNINQL